MILTKRERELIARWIQPDAHDANPAEAVLAEYGVPIWALIGHLRVVDGDVAEVAADYEVPCEAVDAAVAYYHKHQHLIEARLTANAA